MRRLFRTLLLGAAPALLVLATPFASAGEWRDMLRDYEKMRDAHTDCLARFRGFDPEMARLGEAFALTAYPDAPEIGRKNFRRLALRLRLSTPDDARRIQIFVPNKEPWPGYKGKVDSDGLVHFLFNTGTLPLPLLDHPVVGVVRRHDVEYGRVKPIAQCGARVLRTEKADISVIEHDASARAALISKIRKIFDAENPAKPMSDEESRCLADCLPFMA
jgi:hypothetical protein